MTALSPEECIAKAAELSATVCESPEETACALAMAEGWLKLSELAEWQEQFVAAMRDYRPS